MEIKQLNAPFELKMPPNEEGVFEGYASVFDVLDLGFDVVRRGAFERTLKAGHKVRMLWQHDTSQPIGVWDEMREDDRGLFVRGRLALGVVKAREAMDLLRMGALDSMSIGYRVIAASDDANGRTRNLQDVDLMEVSLVTFPMLPAAMVTAVKSIHTIREFEKAMRDAGFSQKEAKAIASRGFDGLAAHRDDVEAWTEAEAAASAGLLDQLRQLKESLSA